MTVMDDISAEAGDDFIAWVASKEPRLATACPRCHGSLMRNTRRSNAHKEGRALGACLCAEAKAAGREAVLWYASGHRQVLAQAGGRVAWVDEGICDDVIALWQNGIWTWVSCQGGGTSTRYVGLLDNSQEGLARELLGWVDHSSRNPVTGRVALYAESPGNVTPAGCLG